MIFRLFHNNFADSLRFPVNPAKFTVSGGGTGLNKFDVVKGGGTVTTGNRKLYTVEWSGFFPRDWGPYCEYRLIPDPWYTVARLNRWREEGQPLRLLITGTNINIPVVFDEDGFTYNEVGGQPGDVYYTIKLREYRFVVIREMLSDEAAAMDKASYNMSLDVSQRPDYASGISGDGSSKVHTVARGDCLYNIALKYYGDGNRYKEIYEANKSLIDGSNSGAAVARYTIYPNQRLVIP